MKTEHRIAIDTRRARLTNSINAIRADMARAHDANNPAAMFFLQLALGYAQMALFHLDLAEKALQSASLSSPGSFSSPYGRS